MTMCYDKPYSPPAPPPSEQRQNVCLDVGCSTIKAVKVAPIAGAVYYEDCDGNVVAGEETVCPTDVFVVNPPPDPIGLTVIEQNLSPVDLFGNPTGQVLKEVRTYDNGILVSTEYQDTTTGAPVSLPAGTAQLAPVSGLDKEVVVLYDDGVPFLRHIAYNYGTMPIQTYDTLLDGLTPYTAVGTVTAGAFGDATAANQATQITIAQNQANEIGTQTDTTVQNGNDGTLISLIKGISKSLYAMFDRFVNKQITIDRFEYTGAGVISIPANCTKIDIYIPVAASIEIDGRPLPSQVDNLVISDDHGRVLSVGTINVTAVGSDPVFVLTYSFN